MSEKILKMCNTSEEVRQALHNALTSDLFTEGDKYIIRMQFRRIIPAGNFEEKLWEILCAADEKNLAKLRLGFPTEVEGLKRFRNGTLGRALIEIFGLEI